MKTIFVTFVTFKSFVRNPLCVFLSFIVPS